MTHVPYQITHELRDIRSHVLNRVKRRIRAERGSVRSLSDARKPEVTFLQSWVVVLPKVWGKSTLKEKNIIAIQLC